MNDLNENVELSIKENINPWISMLFKPRKTIQYIIENNFNQVHFLLVLLYGINYFLRKASSKNLGDKLSTPAILGIAVVIGFLFGMIAVFIVSKMVFYSGKLIGGKATYENIRSAFIWSALPYIYTLILWIPQLVYFGEEVFKSKTPIMDSDASFSFLLVISFLEITMLFWWVIIYLKSLSQVQKFSIWKALLNVILGPGILLGTAFLLGHIMN